MNVITTELPDVLIIEPEVFSDQRGFFYESYNRKKFVEATGVDREFVQDNHTRSAMNVLRGLHYQVVRPQGKLVRVVRGAVYDVVVDLRKSSSTFGKWLGTELSADNARQIWIPEGFAHGFMVISSEAELLYKAADYYAPEYERCIRWNDEDLAIKWPNDRPIVSDKDNRGVSFKDADVFA